MIGNVQVKSSQPEPHSCEPTTQCRCHDKLTELRRLWKLFKEEHEGWNRLQEIAAVLAIETKG